MNNADINHDRKRRAKRNALLLGLVALGFYVLFISLTVFGK
jgi:uncharacterized membrane protein (DUF485 family)